MSRHFYLPQRRPKRALRLSNDRLGAVPVWLRVALFVLIVLTVAWYVWDEFRVQPATSGIGQRAQQEPVGSDSPDGIQPSPASSRPTSDTVAKEFAAQSEIPMPHSTLDRSIRLQVLNGCGVKGLAKLVSPGLRAKGFDVRETRNAGSFKYSYSMVMDRTGNLEMANAVADSLGIDRARVKTEIARNLADIDVTLVVGSDYERLNLRLER